MSSSTQRHEADSTTHRKVCIILEELNLPYVIHELEFNEVKNESYLELNPNGRLPTIKDPNTGVTLWEVSQTKSHQISRLPAL